jgi:hypothetical protein
MFSQFRTPDCYKLTDIGRGLYVEEKNSRNLKVKREDELYKAQLENIKSTTKVNGFQNIVVNSIASSATFSFFTLIISYRQLQNSQVKIKELTNLQLSEDNR